MEGGGRSTRAAVPGGGASFVVSWAGVVGYFTEVSGLDLVQDGSAEPGGNVTLKRGTLEPSEAWWAVRKQLAEGLGREVKTSSITVALRDEAGSVVVTWTLEDALLTKMTGEAPGPDRDCVVFEAIELACTRITCVLEQTTV